MAHVKRQRRYIDIGPIEGCHGVTLTVPTDVSVTVLEFLVQRCVPDAVRDGLSGRLVVDTLPPMVTGRERMYAMEGTYGFVFWPHFGLRVARDEADNGRPPPRWIAPCDYHSSTREYQASQFPLWQE